MTPQKLIVMANEIAAFFRAYPQQEAAAGIRRHLIAFWTPSMLATLRLHIAQGASGLDALVVRGLVEDSTDDAADRLGTPARAVARPAVEAG